MSSPAADSPAALAEPAPKLPSWAHWAFVGLLLVSGLYLNQSKTKVEETDEIKYIILAHRLSGDLGTYTLQGTPLLERITKEVNDVPLFFHPPLLPALLRLWYELPPKNPAREIDTSYVKVPILAHLLTAAILWFYWGRGQRFARRAWPPALYLCMPLAGQMATKIWMGSVVGMFMLLTITLMHWALQKRSYGSYALTGVSLGLGLLAKFTAGALVPVLAFFHFRRLGNTREAWLKLGVAAGTALLAGGWWYLVFYSTYGSFLPTWIKPTEAMMEKFPSIAIFFYRSPALYFLILATTMPVLYFAAGVVARKNRDTGSLMAISVALVVIGAFTFSGLTGGGYPTRHVYPAIAPLCLVAGRVIAGLPKPAMGVAFVLTFFSLFVQHRNVYYPVASRMGDLLVFVPGVDGHGLYERGLLPAWYPDARPTK